MNLPISKMSISSRSSGDMRVDLDIRDLRISIDEPRERGGSNFGPTPTESAVAALAACVSIVVRVIARKKQLNVHSIDVDAEAEFDLRGVMFIEEIDVPFKKIVLSIRIAGDISADEMMELKRVVNSHCPLTKLFSQAGTEISEDWELVETVG